MSLLDVFTGGKSDEALDSLKRAEDYYSTIQSPTIQQLTLPELQKYVEAGIMTPAEAQAYLQQSNAYSDMNVDQTGTAAQMEALNRLSAVADAGDSGTPSEQAAMDTAEQNMNRAIGGQRGAIEQAMAARGTPTALIQAALENQTVGQEGQQAHMDAVNAQSAAYQAALDAMAKGGALGGQLQGQQNTQANTVAGAQNAMQQFNAQNQQQNSQFNAGNQQIANAANAANKQQVSNNNVGLSNSRTQYNAQLPQQVFNNQITKAGGMAGAATNEAAHQSQQGQQNAAINSGMINLASNFIVPGSSAVTGAFQASNPTEANMNQGYQRGYAAHGGLVGEPPKDPIEVGASRGHHDHSVCMAYGGLCMDDGGMVPGDAPFPGDTTDNDVVPANLSPGEIVLPRSTVASHPDEAMSLLSGQDQGADVQDVVTLLKAMKELRMGAQNG